ncbi:VanY-A/VanY-F/VanY-M family D-Ala-D-Ala carboxypeptidase [Gorillibacterium sp. sgz5001074]|uniref:VanY-A/VanY-F/VanY-M family D-Ala-D-Ala carboxypeptidase n=1 Tax=Gorillibacterium sp. sgz5001074 TaxID=3446695 RepID=UPI003F681E6B
MKKWAFICIVVIGLSFVLAHKDLFYPDKVVVQNVNKEAAGSFRTIRITKDQVYQGNLLLVNQVNPIHQESIKSDVVLLGKHKDLVRGYELGDHDVKLSKNLAQTFSVMMAAAEKDGVRHFAINSGYRDYKEQDGLYQEMGPDYALPAGHSEHNLGLSLDVGSTQMKMDGAPEGKWLEKNAWKYGFIIRYPKDKTAITGIRYEPWHIRYVGLPHSAMMQDAHLSLEEYLDFLKNQKSISTTSNGKKYEITYYPVTRDTTIQVPSNLRWEISGNNRDGVIVTVIRSG